LTLREVTIKSGDWNGWSPDSGFVLNDSPPCKGVGKEKKDKDEKTLANHTPKGRIVVASYWDLVYEEITAST